MLTIKMLTNRFWAYRLIFTMICLVLITSACESFVVLPTDTVTSSSQPSPSLTLSPTVTPSITPLPPLITNGTLAYLTRPIGNNKSRIRLINVLNREIRDIEFDCYVCGTFAFSPDGTRIAITGWKEFSNMVDEIFLLDIESGAVRLVTKNPSNCKKDASWAPGGKYLLYTTNDACKSLGNDIEVMEVDTNVTRKLTNTKEGKFQPTWSPDGQYIAYGYRQESDGYLWLMDSNGKNPNQISDMPTGYHFQISWSPDSAKIIFSSPMQCGDIYMVDIKTNTTKKFFRMDGCATNPVWSPDGKAIAILVTNYLPVTNQVKEWKIYLVSVDGKDSMPIVTGKQGEQPPLYLGWAPANFDFGIPSP